jgi:two-component system cell cycle sensor histidine kinase/response regulator CckA
MSQPLRVLILEDRPSDASLVLKELRQAGYEPQWQRVDTEQDYSAHLQAVPDIILADYNLPQFSAPEALQILQKSRLDIPFIIVSGSIGEEIAVAAMKDGATDFLLKDRMGRLGQAVGQALEQRRLRDTQRQAEETLRERTQFILLTAEVGVSLNRVATLHDMLQPCAESLVRNLDIALARIWTFNEAENALDLQASAGLETRLDGMYSRVPVGTHGIGRLAQDRVAYVTNELTDDPGFEDHQWAEREGLTAFAGYPLIVEDRLVGVIAMFARHPLAQATLDGLATVANQIAAGTERKRTEERLQFTQFTIDHIATAVFWFDATGKFFNVNEAACHLTGYTRAELLALHIHDLDINIKPQNWLRHWQEIQHRKTLSKESRLRRKNGVEIPVSIHTNPLQNSGRDWCCSFVQDTIEREAAEFAQRQSDLQFRAIFNHTFEFLGLLNCDGTVLEINQPALDFRGLKLADVAGIPLWETQWLDMSVETREHVRRAIIVAAGGGFVRNEMTVRDTQQMMRTFDFSVKPVMNDAGSIQLLIVEARDITDQKRIEEQFRQSQKMEAIGQLAGGVAHDFNNLLTIILGYSDFWLQGLAPEGMDGKDLIHEIHRAAERASLLTRQLLTFSRRQVVDSKSVSVNAIVSDMETMLRRLIGENIHIRTILTNQNDCILADRGQIEQVIMNLAVNARDAMPQGGELSIETSNVELDSLYCQTRAEVRPGKYVMIAISDTGCGMDEATQARIFEPFFTTKEVGKGTGLGLATVYGIVKQSGGIVWVYSEIGHGTTFKIYLPVTQQGTEDSISQHLPSADLRGVETVLLVEDDPGVLAFSRTALQAYGYRVLTANDPHRAVQISRTYPGTIDLLMTDVIMPRLNGRRLAEILQSERSAMKVLYVSGYTDDAIVRQGILESDLSFLQKPFAPHVLATKIRHLMQRHVAN